MEDSTTGIIKFNSEFPREAISFEDPICPHCGADLNIDTMLVNSHKLSIRYRCAECNFICPIGYSGEEMEIQKPLYDGHIYNFLSTFGEDIHSRIKKLEVFE